MNERTGLPGFFAPKEMSDAKKMAISNPIELRDLRNQVRYTASLVSSFYPVREKMGDVWRCFFYDRVIEWRPTSPFPPHGALSPREILFLVVHESGHLNFTGGWNTPQEWNMNKERAFAGFLNFVEDIRIERLMGQKFPGFEAIRKPVNEEFIQHHNNIESRGQAIWNQVALYWMVLENCKNPGTWNVGHPKCRAFALDLWADIDRIANAESTNSVARELIPIFEQLWEEQENCANHNKNNGIGQDSLGQGMSPDASEGLDGGGDKFGDSPSSNPVREMPEKADAMTPEEQIKEMARTAKGEAKREMERLIASANKAKEHADRLARMIKSPNDDQEGKGKTMDGDTASGIGDEHSPNRARSDHWNRARRRMDPQIRSLSHRLRSTLRTNMMSDWTEGLRRGNLNTRRAKRAVAGNNRIFRRRHTIGAHDYTFGIVDDCSGSMRSGHEPAAPHVLDMTVLLSEAFERAEMNYFIITHDTLMLSGKTITQSIRSVDEQIAADIVLSNGGTYECPALIVAQEQFRRVVSGHKVMFVLSDGRTTNIPHSQAIVNELGMEGVRVIGVGLRQQPPAHHPQGIRVDDVTQLPAILPRLINDIVRKGGR